MKTKEQIIAEIVGNTLDTSKCIDLLSILDDFEQQIRADQHKKTKNLIKNKLDKVEQEWFKSEGMHFSYIKYLRLIGAIESTEND